MPTIQLGDVNYNAARGAFEARVDIHADGRSFRYPCHVSGPLNMDMEFVRTRLARQAIGMSDSGATLLSKI